MKANKIEATAKVECCKEEYERGSFLSTCNEKTGNGEGYDDEWLAVEDVDRGK